jgi:hypothetical protein
MGEFSDNADLYAPSPLLPLLPDVPVNHGIGNQQEGGLGYVNEPRHQGALDLCEVPAKSLEAEDADSISEIVNDKNSLRLPSNKHSCIRRVSGD